MAKTKATKAPAEDPDSLSGALRGYMDLNRKTLEEQVEAWKSAGEKVRQGNYDMQSAVKDTQDGVRRAMEYCTDLLEVTMRCATAFTGSLTARSEK